MERRVDDISFTFLEVEEDFDGEDVLLGASIYYLIIWPTNETFMFALKV